MSEKRPPGRRVRASTPPPRARRRRRAARRRGLSRLLVAGVLVGVVAVAGLVVLTPTAVITGTPSLETPGPPRISETAGTMLRVSWRPVMFSDYYELTIVRDDPAKEGGGPKPEVLRVEGTETEVTNLTSATDYAVKVRAVKQLKDEDPVRSEASRATPIRTAGTGKPALLVPANPEVTKAGNTYLDITWDPVETATGYRVQLASDDNFRNPRTIKADGRTTTFKRLDAATPFTVRVRALGGQGFKSAWTEVLRTETIKPDDPQPLAVGTYNIRCHRCGGPPWVSRRAAVAGSISSHGLDVVGLQEAQQSTPRGVSTSQFTDLMRQLEVRQGGWKLTDERINGTLGVRIIYNTNAVRLVKAGATRYAKQLGGSEFRQRFYTWAIFTQRSSGKDFLFVDTHLEPNSVSVRLSQARQLAADAARLRGNLPAVVVGDLNASQYHVYGAHQALTAAGFVDPLGILPSSHAVSDDATVEKRINTHLDSFNNFSSRPVGSVRPPLNGTYIDYIFSTPMRVLEYENVVDLDASGRFRGGAPSDHNMLRAVVGLP
ncbi:MAG: fibronectin type III domain-containing protein [Aeromicrobium sp.]